MTDKIIIKIKDTICSHDCSVFPDTEHCTYIRNRTPNGDIEIKKDDIVIYTDTSLRHLSSLSKKNVALMIESPEIHRLYYNFIENNNHLFDSVLTFSKKLLDKGQNYKFNAYGTTWLHETYRNIWTKDKLCSLILSNNKTTSGHILRHNITTIIINRNINIVNIFGSNYIPLPYMTSKNFEKDHCGAHISNQKISALKDYMFSIAIENTKEDYYFTEKIIDCFLSGTIPIYYGCPSISNFFNEKGILSFTTLNECLNIINTLSIEKYNDMLPYVKENFEKAKQYDVFKINDSHILDL